MTGWDNGGGVAVDGTPLQPTAAHLKFDEIFQRLDRLEQKIDADGVAILAVCRQAISAAALDGAPPDVLAELLLAYNHARAADALWNGTTPP